MAQAINTSSNDTLHDLSRFIDAQESTYADALSELRCGHKQGHWMWFIFPQLRGLGRSETAEYYSIKTMEEARQYLSHPVLGARLEECAKAILTIKGYSALAILGYPDDMKLKSSMTLFSSVAKPSSIFEQVLDKYFDGQHDARTRELLNNF